MEMGNGADQLVMDNLVLGGRSQQRRKWKGTDGKSVRV